MVIKIKGNKNQKTLKYMLSQPMNGREEEDIKKDRIILEEMLKKDGIEIIDTVFPNFPKKPEMNIPIAYLSKSIESISKADAVVFMNGWQEARGCKIEHEICLQYGVKVYYANPFGQIFETQEIK